MSATTRRTSAPLTDRPRASLATRDDVVLGGAVITTGLLAGLFYAYACSVMPGLRGSSDATVVDAMQHINRSIQNPAFFATFLGGPALSAWAYVNERRHGTEAVARWVLAGTVLGGACLLVTFAANIPLNDALDRAGDAGQISELAKVRADFEGPWIAWNIVRAVSVVGAFGCLAAALYLRARRR